MLSNRGIMTITVILSIMSIPFVQIIHTNEYARRLMCNPDYSGTYGGEILIPLLILLIGMFYTIERKENRYEKYYM